MLNAVLRSHWSIFGKNESCGQSCGSFTEVYRSASIRKSQENLWIIIYLGLPCAFQDWFWHNYRQYILESQLNCYFEYFASKGQQAKCKSRRAFSFKAIVGNIRFPAAENFHTIVPDINELFRLCPFINILGWNACKI